MLGVAVLQHPSVGTLELLPCCKCDRRKELKCVCMIADCRYALRTLPSYVFASCELNLYASVPYRSLVQNVGSYALMTMYARYPCLAQTLFFFAQLSCVSVEGSTSSPTVVWIVTCPAWISTWATRLRRFTLVIMPSSPTKGPSVTTIVSPSL